MAQAAERAVAAAWEATAVVEREAWAVAAKSVVQRVVEKRVVEKEVA